MQRSAIVTATLLSALGLTYIGCTQDFNQFEPSGGAGGSGAASSSSSSMVGPGGAGGTGGVGGAGGMGGMPCMNPGDCPMDTACRDWNCTQGMCVATDAADGDPLPDPTDGDCKDLACNGMGGEKVIDDNGDTPPGDGNPCTDGVCVAGAPVQMPTPGDACPDGVCDAAGMCVECVVDGDCTGLDAACMNNTCIACDDGVMNGAETGIDCGGTCAKKCIADACTANGDCLSNFCADGVCCDTACTGACMACDLPIVAGTCTDIPVAGTDDAPACMGTMACDGAGACKLANTQPCNNGMVCASGKCEGAPKVCVP